MATKCDNVLYGIGRSVAATPMMACAVTCAPPRFPRPASEFPLQTRLQLVPLDLARGTPGEVVERDEVDPFRLLESRQTRTAQVIELRLGQCVVAARHEDGRHFPPVRIGLPHHGGLRDSLKSTASISAG